MGIGWAAIWFIRLHEVGSAMRMQSGWFPTMLGRILMVFGAILVFRGIRAKAETKLEWGWWPLACITASLLLFGFLLPRFGLVPALAALLVTAAAGGREFELGEVLALAILMIAFAIMVFAWFLKLPLPLVPGVFFL